jgi:integrase
LTPDWFSLLCKHIAPVLGGLAIADIQASKVRRWRKQLIDSGVSAVTVAKAYRLLKAVLNTALDDGVIRRNPCRIKGAGQEESPERPTLTIAQVYALVDAVGPRYRALILLAMFSSLRWGELGGLRRCDIDLATRTVRVTRQLNEVSGGGFEFGPPKSRAGKRSVPIPAVIVPIIRWHLACFAQQGEEGLVFTSPAGKPLRHTNFRRRVWPDALGAANLPAIHFHDLRHTGNTLAANAGASLRELMERMRHDSERAALVYLHSSEERQHQIADTFSKLATEEMKRGSKRQGGESTTRRSGTPPARNRKQAS